MVQLFVDRGANLSLEYKGCTLLCNALRHGRRQTVLTLLRAGAPCRALTSTQIKHKYVALNDWMIQIMNAGGWAARVERHRRPLMSILSRLALPRDALSVVLSFWSPPGGHSPGGH